MNNSNNNKSNDLKSILLSWEDINPDFIRMKKWEFVMFFPSFTIDDGNKILNYIEQLNLNKIIEFDSRYIDGDVNYCPQCLSPSIDVIMGKDARQMFSVPRVITNNKIEFVVLMTSEYWCFYGEKNLLELSIGMSLNEFHNFTKNNLINHYSDTEMLTYQNKISELG